MHQEVNEDAWPCNIRKEKVICSPLVGSVYQAWNSVYGVDTGCSDLDVIHWGAEIGSLTRPLWD